MKVAIIILCSVVGLLMVAVGVLGFKVYALSLISLDQASKFQNIQKVSTEEVQKEFAAKEASDAATRTFMQAFSTADNALKAEIQAKDRLTPESFETVFHQSFEGFNAGIRMAEQAAAKYPDTFYGQQLATQGLILEGQNYPIPALRQNRDLVLQRFMENRGVAVAFLTRNECKLIDNAISQALQEGRVTMGTDPTWEQIQPYFRPDGRLASSGGNDILGNPFTLTTLRPDRSNVRISKKTRDLFKEAKFDWGQYAPEE
ncbi:MAG: hypothetical protein SFY92_07400 [Verrucomicrobiae bacterium]|nr:hypothetical protein [Verrucomicrobiae bacterium]